VGLATTAAATLLAGLSRGDGEDGESEAGEEESDIAVLTRTACKLAMRKIKRAKRGSATRRRRP